MRNLAELGRSGRCLWLAIVLVLVQACSRGAAREFLGPNPGASSPLLVRLSVVPRSAQLVLGDSVRLVAYGQFLNGDSAVAPVTWSSRIGAISEAGWYRAMQEGADTIRAVSKAQPALSDAATLDLVNPLDLAVVRLTPQAATLPSGSSIQFTARTTLPDGSEITPEVTWSSTGGTISPAGLFSALGQPGTYQVTAQITGRTRSGSTAVTVGPASLDNLLLNPSSVSLAAGEARQFAVAASWSDGSSTLPPLTWSATGGTVSPSGLYTSGQAAGTFRVVAASAAGDRADTSEVSVSVLPPTLTRVILTPSAVALAPGAIRQFTVAGIWSDGSAAVPTVTYSATGGTITANGLYTAGAPPGSFRVIATHQGGTRADTSIVTIAAPAAILLQLVLSPSSVTLPPGAPRQFTVAGSWSDGSTSTPAASHSATGGTITAGGLYTAGTTPGTYRVIATHQGGTKADTSTVTIAAPAAILLQLVLNPASLTLAPGATRQFTVTGTWSDGSSSAPAVIYSAAGGTIMGGGLYTADTTAGTYRVVAAQIGGTRADTAVVTVDGVPGLLPLWTAGMETGNLKEWEDNVYQSTPCGGQFNSGQEAVTVPSTDYARSGLWSAKMSIGGNSTAANTNGTRMHRWCENRVDRELFYSVWYYIPQRLTVSGSGWLNLFQFKSKPTDGSSSAPFFFLVFRNDPVTGAMRFQLTWWGGLTIEGPSPGQSGYRTWESSQVIPAGKWFQVEARYVCAGDFTGAMQVWLDGVEIFKLDGVRTRYPAGDCHWGVNNYGTGISPSPVVIYIDDAVISRSKIGQ